MRTGRTGWALLLLCVPAYLACDDVVTEVEFFSVDGRELSSAEKRTVESIARSTVREARTLLPTLPKRVTIRVQPGHEVIAETGETGAAAPPSTIVWTVDPKDERGVTEIARRWLRACLFHELHHLVRDAAITRTSLLDFAVTEGMATAFERDFAGVAVPWGQYPPEAAAWVEELRALPDDAQRGPWLTRHPDGRRWVAMRAGTYLVDRAARASQKSAADLVLMSTAEILRLASLQ